MYEVQLLMNKPIAYELGTGKNAEQVRSKQSLSQTELACNGPDNAVRLPAFFHGDPLTWPEPG